ncbi:MAG: hypothetical protein MJE68_04855 [Proteobacteria bacterium]|nr:hypothetical protein [Pseudomonadota bacterium]
MSVVFTITVPTLDFDFIKSMVTVINPIRQIAKAIPRQIVEMRVGLYLELPA